MHRSCFLQIVNSSTKRVNYFNAWTCSSHMSMNHSIRIRNKARTKNHWWTKLVIEENLYHTSDPDNGKYILILLTRRHLIWSASSGWTSVEDQKAFRLVRQDQSQGRSDSDADFNYIDEPDQKLRALITLIHRQNRSLKLTISHYHLESSLTFLHSPWWFWHRIMKYPKWYVRWKAPPS